MGKLVICIPRVLQKVWHDKAEGILVVPDWLNQLWYTQCTEMIIKEISLPSRSGLVSLPSQMNIDIPCISHYNFEEQLSQEAIVTAHQSENVKSLLLA